ncbi:YEATS domain-containing protein 4 isoform 6-T6 [Trichechus inunguis]|uniref:YEATS domain-containing protein 4 isoform X4 n=1 Tax=Trichechus manatus latirostris TaxID=127582 RepID=A0A2Y9RSD7_TRIMA|nr:YEATS domain-containing protein 4 isoform X4 [Trichechus manatus latirostris]
MFKRMAEFGPDSGGRVKPLCLLEVMRNMSNVHLRTEHGMEQACLPNFSHGVTIVKPIVYGNVARYFGKKREEDGHTHQWTVYVKPYRNEVTLYHLLKLFQSDTNAMLGKKTVVSEFYDEMIFQDPTAMMQQLLTTSRQLTLGAYKHETEFAELEVKTREKLEAAKKKTSFEIAELKERLKASRETINCLKNEIRKLEEDDQTKEI